MIISRLKGGLGNFMSQIAAGYSLALDKKVDFRIDPNRINSVHTHWKEYMSNIFRKIKIVSGVKGLSLYRYDGLTYKHINVNDNVVIDGYFQSEKYYLKHKQAIIDLFKIDDVSLKYIQGKYGHLLNKNSCAIHVRRGNFLKISWYNKLEMGNYYNKAIDIIGRDKNFLIFSDDMVWCKNAFKDINATFIEGEKDYIDMYLISMCQDVITANSTFSWWGAYLNTSKNSRIVTTATRFTRKHSNKDLNPPNWIKI